jgi:hypothetical protein
MTTQHSSDVDIEATRRQFLFAREQISSHCSAARWRTVQQTRLRSAHREDEFRGGAREN